MEFIYKKKGKDLKENKKKVKQKENEKFFIKVIPFFEENFENSKKDGFGI